jgi:hypothetical protein
VYLISYYCIPRKQKHTLTMHPPLAAVCLSQEAYLACIGHALTTEREEVMGLLLGDVKVSSSCGVWQILSDLSVGCDRTSVEQL